MMILPSEKRLVSAVENNVRGGMWRVDLTFPNIQTAKAKRASVAESLQCLVKHSRVKVTGDNTAPKWPSQEDEP